MMGAVDKDDPDENIWEEFWDDQSGERLDYHGVREARKEAMEEVKKHQVWVKVPTKECWERTGKAPIKTRWVDINKGDRVHPEYRSRLVCKELNTGKREDLFAATPPLEALKILFAGAVTRGVGYEENRAEGMKLDFIDI